MTALIVTCVVLAVLLICGGLAAFDLITQLDEDLDDARAELASKDAQIAHLIADLCDHGANVVPLDPRRKERISALIAKNHAAVLDRTDAATFLGGFDNTPNGDPA